MLSLSQLVARCQNRQPDGSHEPFCFELFRRAIVEGCSLAWHHVYGRYYPQVRYWIYRCLSADDDTVDDAAQSAFATFWQYYTRDKLERARGLASVLAYLKTCAVSAAKQQRRRMERASLELVWDDQVVERYTNPGTVEESAPDGMSPGEIWDLIESRCQDERDRCIADFCLRLGLSPRHIVERRPDLFPDVNEVYRVKRNLISRLRRDPVLCDIYETHQR